MKISKKDIQGTYRAVEPNNSEPITISSLEKIWTKARVIPYKFRPTGEIVYFTPEVAFRMEEEKKKSKPLPEEKL